MWPQTWWTCFVTFIIYSLYTFPESGINSAQPTATPHSHLSSSFGSPGEVFPASAPDRLTHLEASAHCASVGGQLATVGQLYLAWRSGLDHCEPGWLSDGSVRFSVSAPRSDCAGGEAGVRTVPPAELSNGSARFDAFCYHGTECVMWHSHVFLQLLLCWDYFIDLEMQRGFDHVVNYDEYVKIYSIIFLTTSVTFLIQQMPFIFHLGNKEILFFTSIIIIMF